jgi:D-alanyl-D-alanine dipeptidase
MEGIAVISHGLVEVVSTATNKILIKDLAPSPLLVRGVVLEKILQAAQSLPADCQLIIYEGHRSQTRQFGYWNRRIIATARKFPEMTDREIIDETRRWTADPVDRPSGHQAGAAVDLTIVQQGEEIDMGCKISDFNDKTPTKCAGLTAEQQVNRERLCSIMEATGMINYNEEW